MLKLLFLLAAAPILSVDITAMHPHDPAAFTQGLLYHQQALYESTGLYGQSSLRLTDPETGEVLKITRLPGQYFGEGLALVQGNLFQLTWRSGQVFVYDPATLAKERQARIPGQGWGAACDGRDLVVSDGSDTLVWYSASTLAPQRSIRVRDGDTPVALLNELEWINGRIFANVWHRDDIAIIDPATGQVEYWLDLESLRELVGPYNGDNDLNGIAYDPETGRLFITGKLWPRLFEVTIPDNPSLTAPAAALPGN